MTQHSHSPFSYKASALLASGSLVSSVSTRHSALNTNDGNTQNVHISTSTLNKNNLDDYANNNTKHVNEDMSSSVDHERSRFPQKSEMRILLVDDDKAFIQATTQALQNVGEFTVKQALSIDQARLVIKDYSFDAYVLDVHLGDGDGRDLCLELRQKGVTAPIIMLTADNQEMSEINGLESGANDYVNKPLRSSVLIARLNAHLKQNQAAQDAVFEFANFIFCPSQKTLANTESESVIRLTEKEVSLLTLLIRSKGRIVSKEELLQRGWGYAKNINTHTLETHVYRLRQKINNSVSDEGVSARSLLLTENGGYRLNVR